ncbi:hypothetical protein FQR65_LT12179 [Abscondita terminalis]|nr:hypothetical protein FQR65_LT12179 [Abscondita terminalis]
MKFILLLFGIGLCSGLELTAETFEKWEKLVSPHIDKCQTETNVDPEVAQNFYKQFYFPNDKNFQCYVKCIAVKLNFMDSSGKINVDVLTEATDKESGQIAEECSKLLTKTDLCEIAFEFSTCCMKKSAELYGHH